MNKFNDLLAEVVNKTLSGDLKWVSEQHTYKSEMTSENTSGKKVSMTFFVAEGLTMKIEVEGNDKVVIFPEHKMSNMINTLAAIYDAIKENEYSTALFSNPQQSEEVK